MILFHKHTWVCSICGQGLTRKSTANRHNNNQHSGGALLVRPYDYIIRRLNGRFLPSDPSLYRHSNKGQDNSISNSVYQRHHGTRFGAIPNNNV